MYKEKSKISELIYRSLKGELNPKEQNELDLWLKDDHNKKVYRKITSKEAILKKAREYDDDGMNEVWKRLDKQLFQKPDYQKWLSYAAVIVLPLAIGFFLLYQMPEPPQELAKFESIQPGESNAKLYFSNGEVVDLKKDTSALIRSNDNLVVERKENELRINSSQISTSNAIRTNRIVTPVGGEYDVVLSDGTKVWLNADSYLEFPSKFSDNVRKVIARGEVYFDVAGNAKWPFIVESGGMELKVLGTEFNLRNYHDEEEMITSLVEGSVEVSNALKEKVILKPGREVLIATADNSMLERKADLESVTGWRKGRFIFKKKRVEDIMYELERWYNVKVFFTNSSVKDVTITLDVARYDNIEDILGLMEGTREVSFNISGKIISVN
jgi:hypothetical protein